MRLFTAIDISAEVREHLRMFVGRLKPLARFSWSPAENLHITTKFIGEWEQSRLDEIKAVLTTVPPTGPIDISIRGIGWFPTAQRPRVFWAGVEASESLRTLAANTEAATGRAGVPLEDRTYSPHLTLARIREPLPLDAIRKELEAKPKASGAAPAEKFDFGTFRATGFHLYLSAAGRYTRLAEFSLI
ncbi:MAG: RNA 2',3'-cyclic phosphodiesterase [Bryobacteraceae bacterium]